MPPAIETWAPIFVVTARFDGIESVSLILADVAIVFQ